MQTLTVEQARQGGIASGIARKNTRAEVKQLKAEVAALKSQQILVPVQPADVYIHSKLARVRERVDSVLDKLEKESEPQAIDRLASALARLNEIERQLANRPLPGSLKPESQRKVRQALSEPTPISSVQQATPQPDLPKP